MGDKAEELCETPLHAERFFQGAWEMGRVDRALALCDTLLKVHPQSVDFLRLKVLSLRRLGELLRAERTLQILLGLDPEDEAEQLYRRAPQETTLISRSQALLQSLEKQAAEKAPLLQTGPFQRTLRSLMMALKNLVPADAVHYIVCRLWRKMPVSWRQACDRKHSPHPADVGPDDSGSRMQEEQAAKLYAMLLHKKRLRRLARQLKMWYDREGR